MHLRSLLPDQNRLAARLLDRFLRRLRELVRVNRDGAGEFAVVQYLDQAVLLAQQAERDNVFERELGIGRGGENLGDAIETEHRVFDAEDIVEAALGKAAM